MGSKIILNKEIRIAVCKNMAQALQVMSDARWKPDFVLVIYSFQPGEKPYSHVLCGNEEALRIAESLFTSRIHLGQNKESMCFTLYLDGPGEIHRNDMLESLPYDDMWGYVDFRYTDMDGYSLWDDEE